MANTIITVISAIFQMIISLYFYTSLFEKKRELHKIIFISMPLYGLFALQLSFLNYIFINALSLLIINLILSHICYSCNTSSAVLSSIFTAIVTLFSDYISQSVIQNSDNTKKAFSMITSKLLLLIILDIATVKKMYFTKRMEAKFPVFLLLFPLTAVPILYIFIEFSLKPMYESMRNAIFITSILLLLSIILCFIFYSKTAKELDSLYSQNSERTKATADKDYYAVMDRQNEKLKQILHDEKIHLATIKSMNKDPEIESYIDTISKQIVSSSQFGNTKNKYLDLIINKYSFLCEELNIKLTVSVKTANLSFMENTDLISLLGNILDNAVESAKFRKRRKSTFQSIK